MDYFFGQERAFQVMAKPIGAMCNLNCTYCYYLEKKNLYAREEALRMPLEVAEQYVKQYIESQSVPVVTFIWQGGEPCLMGIDFYKQILEFQKRYAGDKQIANSFQTNGVLLNAEWCRFLKENNFLVGISIDGSREIHDHYRCMKNGASTWTQVMRSLELLKEFEIEFNTLTVINDYNSDYSLEIYHFLKEIGSRFQQYIPIVERKVKDINNYPLTLVSPDYGINAELTEWSVDSKKYGKFMIDIFDEWVKYDVGNVFVQLFDAALAGWYGVDPGLCVYNKTCGNALVVEHNGDIYSCDHYVYPENKLGNILKSNLSAIFDSSQHADFGKHKETALTQYCRQCKYLFACNGECPKHRFVTTPNGEMGHNYLCDGLRLFYKHVEPYMNFMVEEIRNKRSPANVMNLFTN